MGGAALVGLGRHHPDIVAERPGDPLQRLNAHGVDAVVVADQDARRPADHDSALAGDQPLAAVEVGAQGIGDDDAAVGLLIVLEHRDQGPARPPGRSR